MSEPNDVPADDDYRGWAGRLLFPRTTTDLTDTTRCPACFTPLRSSSCTSCGLNLAHPAATELHDTSLTIARLLDQRANLIGRMRHDVGPTPAPAEAATEPDAQPSIAPDARPEAPAAAAFPPPARVIAAPAAATPPSPTPPSPAPSAPATAATTPPATGVPAPATAVADASAPRRSSVQITLLAVGISLLSIAAIFFLVYAFITFGLVWRSVIIAGITVGAIAAASLLRRKGLTATAEGIAVFGAVMVLLDLWAARENNLAGLGATDAGWYWGIGLLLVAAGFTLWHRFARLRAPLVAAALVLAPGAGTLAHSIAAEASESWAPSIGLLAVVATGLVHLLVPRFSGSYTAERIIVLGVAGLAAIPAMLAAPASRPGDALSSGGHYAIAAAITAVLLALLAYSLLRTRRDSLDRFFAIAFAALGGVALSIAAFAAGTASEQHWLIIAPPLLVLVTLVLDQLRHRQTPGETRTLWLAASIGSAVLSGLAVLFLLPRLTLPMLGEFATALTPLGATEPTAIFFSPEPEWSDALLGLLVVAGLVIVGALTTGRHPARVTIAAALAAATAFTAVPALESYGAATAGWHALALICLAVLFWVRRRSTGVAGIRAVAAVTLVVSLLAGTILAHSGLVTWLVSIPLVLAVLLTSRLLVSGAAERAVLLGAAVAISIITAGMAAQAMRWPDGRILSAGEDAAVSDAAHLILLLAAVLLAVGAVLRMRGLSDADRHALFWMPTGAGLIAAAVALLVPRVAPFDGAPVTSSTPYLPVPLTTLLAGIAVLAAFVLWSIRVNAERLRLPRVVAAVAVGPAILVVVDAFARLAALPPELVAVAPATAGLLAAAAALVGGLRRTQTVPRGAREIGVGLVAVPALVTGVQGGGTVWLALLITGVTALLLAINADGLFGSASPRKHLGWLALAFATAGLWTRLADRSVVDLEPYVLPLGIALVAIGILVARAQHRRSSAVAVASDEDAGATGAGDAGTARRPGAGPLIVLAGLLVALLPLGAAGITGPLLRPVLVFAVSALLLLAGTLIRRVGLQPWLDAIAAAGAAGVLLTGAGRALTAPRGTLEVDLWTGALVLALVIAAFALASRTDGSPSGLLRTRVGTVLAVIALVAVLVLEVGHVDSGAAGTVRALVLVLFFAAVHLIAMLVDRAPLGTVTGWTAIGLGLVAAGYGIGVSALDPAETGTVPLAAALLAGGAHRLSTTPTARSFPWLGPGLLLLLVPSLVITAWDAPLWRLVGLGIGGVATVIVGVIGRLQAPFLIGTVVTLWHAIGTFWPQIVAVYESVEWWLWLGIGGVILVALAARYEQRMRNVRTLALKIAALR